MKNIPIFDYGSETDRPTIRVFNRRKRQWVELPDEIPGHAYHHGRRNGKWGIYLWPVETIERSAQRAMAVIDAMSPAKRWKENYGPYVDLTTPAPWRDRRKNRTAKEIITFDNLI